MKKYSFSGQRIRYKIISFLMIIFFMIIMSYVLFFQQFHEERQVQLDKNMHYAEMTATYLDDYLNSNKRALQNLALTDAIKQERASEITQILQNYSLAQPETSLYWVANSKGIVISKFPDNKLDSNLADRDYFQEAMKGNPYVGGPYVCPQTGKEIIIITVPYYRDDKVSGIVGMTIPLSEVQMKLTTLQTDQSVDAALISLEGKVLSHPDLEEFRKKFVFKDSPIYQRIIVSKEKSGYFDNDSFKTVQEMHTFKVLKEVPWVVIMAQPLVEFNLRANQTGGRNLAVFFLLILFLSWVIHYLLLLRDMSHAEKTNQTEKLALVGELAAGIAHEIRNPLTSIKGFIQLISQKKGKDIPHLYIETILEELDRIDQIVGEMVVLAKPAPETKRKVNLDKLLQETVNLMIPQAHIQEVGLTLEIEPGLPYIFGVSNQLKQVFINLIKNAIEAMDHGGTVAIKASQQSGNIVITITDTGRGMSQETLKKAGTPFFSTKDMGTGLGLAITFRLIQNHKGKVCIQSEVGVGTEFKIIFPAADQSEQ